VRPHTFLSPNRFQSAPKTYPLYNPWITPCWQAFPPTHPWITSGQTPEQPLYKLLVSSVSSRSGQAQPGPGSPPRHGYPLYNPCTNPNKSLFNPVLTPCIWYHPAKFAGFPPLSSVYLTAHRVSLQFFHYPPTQIPLRSSRKLRFRSAASLKQIFKNRKLRSSFTSVKVLQRAGLSRSQGRAVPAARPIRVGKSQIMLGEVIEFKKKNAAVPL
jgi:hypothetical protein